MADSGKQCVFVKTSIDTRLGLSLTIMIAYLLSNVTLHNLFPFLFSLGELQIGEVVEKKTRKRKSKSDNKIRKKPSVETPTEAKDNLLAELNQTTDDAEKEGIIDVVNATSEAIENETEVDLKEKDGDEEAKSEKPKKKKEQRKSRFKKMLFRFSRLLKSTVSSSPGAFMASAVTASGKVEKGHQLYRDGKYKEALLFYTEALTAAKAKPQKIALHSNRAASEECTCVLELDQKHSGALMLRAQTLVTLKEYQSALFDVTRLMELNPDSESLAPIPESEAELEEESDVEQDAEDKESREVELGVNERRDKRFESVVFLRRDLETTGEDAINKGEVVAPKTPEVREQNSKEVPMSGKQSNAWQAIPKPKGHSTLDYARWNTVEDDSSEEEDDEDSDDSDESPPQYRFRVKTVGVRPVK
ncbi:unnamed protein product [Arabidopsis thaliana]|uniref:(thale cress) hypothetical protein n=1 Tax=Arabidopsis thaliana TaxID=3702 RepID=A0A7G2E1G2_ARATH|nr:unnamed protein product [Arabidopsis thaliana]